MPSEDYYPEGECTQVSVYENEHKESLVLDQNGRPYLLVRPFKIGFDLTPRGKNESNS